MTLINARMPVLGFAAASGTGKTTLLEQLIPLLKQTGLQVGLIKHSHHNIQVDQPGKDSYRLRAAGASPVMLVSSHRRVMMTEFSEIREPVLAEELLAFDQTGLDLILVEGFKSARFPKIELHRAELGKPLLYPADPDVIAVASDTELVLPTGVAFLNLNDIGQIKTFVLQFINKAG